jgi:phosphatidyl-myo-inositol alpha-mannosyltransferase
MRIALVSPYDWCVKGGVNNHVEQLARFFRTWGHDVTIFAPASWPDAVAGECYVFGKPWTIPIGGAKARISFSWMSPKAKDLLAEGDFDIMHGHEPLMPLVPYHLFRYSRAVKVGTFHAAAPDHGFHFYGPTKFMAKMNFRKLDGKIAVSPAAVKHISRFYAGYYNVIPNGIEYEHFAKPAAPIPEFMDGKKNILFVGRPEPRKGLPYLLRAYLQVREQEPDTRLIVVGAGDFSRYKNIMKAFPDVVFRENVSYTDLPRYHHSAHVFCCPNTGNESFGLVLSEAMAAGLPVVASNIEAFAAIVTPEHDGLLVRPRDDEAIAQAILRILRNRAFADALGRQATAKASEYSWDSVARKVMAYYERLLWARGKTAQAREAAASILVPSGAE